LRFKKVTFNSLKNSNKKYVKFVVVRTAGTYTLLNVNSKQTEQNVLTLLLLTSQFLSLLNSCCPAKFKESFKESLVIQSNNTNMFAVENIIMYFLIKNFGKTFKTGKC
jgi:hypothetical protein